MTAAIQEIRQIRVVLDTDLAGFYGVKLGPFNQAVQRNADLFDGYRFQLTKEEVVSLQSQDVIAKPRGRGGRRSQPWVFNHYGVVIAGTIFRSERARKVTRMLTEAFVDGAAIAAQLPATASEVLPAAGFETTTPTTPQLNTDQLLDLANNIINSGEQGLIDWIKTPTTERQKAVAATMKTLVEMSGLEVQNDQQRLRLAIAGQLARGEYRDDDHRAVLLDVLREL